MRRTTSLLAAVATSVPLLAGGGAALASDPAPAPGSTTSGDSLFPDAGNGGYDAQHYRVSLAYRAGGTIAATTRMTARALRPLSSYSLDLEGLGVRSVRVDGRSARFVRHGDELVVTPARAVRGTFTTTVTYAGRPQRHTDPDGTGEGWIATPDGATTVNEPVGSKTWFPGNDTPRDKATYTFVVSAPSRLAVAGNGVLASRVRHGARTTWTWRSTEPMASYLAMVSIGDYRVYRSSLRTLAGRTLPVWSFVQPSLGTQAAARALLPKVVRWGEHRFGPYPFSSSGLVAHTLDVGYALETQDRPVFPGPVDASEEVHELAHQWFGDSVTPGDWGDIWLNEGFATYAQWLWDADHGGTSTEATFRTAYADNGPTSDLWSPAPAALSDPKDLFGPAYLRGAMTLQVLRDRVGDTAFFAILRAWAREHRFGTVATADFTRLAERVSGQQLDDLFRDWLLTPSRPSGY
ncbi:MAG: pepN 2 [Marmoricola sp.]|nr:pepN 2 [Marmoricola sp.]